MLRLVIDENIPYAGEAFSRFGAVELFPGRKIDSTVVRDADILIVRSVTPVDRNLLEGSRVRFVGTATIGTDHVDNEYLQERGIAFADAAGCNANSVSEYVAAALLDLEAALGTSFAGLTIGVVGVGNVGKRVVEKARVLGMNVLCNDPPRALREGDEGFISLEKILRESDVISLHTPLQSAGPFSTHHLIGPAELEQMKPGAVLLNTSRGAVVDSQALTRFLKQEHLRAAVLDVWEGEPSPDPELVSLVSLGTPHIAGYSLDGKLTGTKRMVEALARFLAKTIDPESMIPDVPVESPVLALKSTGREALREAVFKAYPIQEDDRRLRSILDLPKTERPASFDRLRKEYPVRREFHCYSIRGRFLSGEDIRSLGGLGFQTSGD